MAYIPLTGGEAFIETLLTADEIKSLDKRGLYLDTEFYTLWTKTDNGEMVNLGGGKAISIEDYPGLGEILTTTLPIAEHTKNGNPTRPIEVLNHLYARATTVEQAVRNPRVVVSNVEVDKEAETITFSVAYIDFNTLYRSELIITPADGVEMDPLNMGSILTLPEQIVNPDARTLTVPMLEFSEIRNRIMVTAYTEDDEYFESNRITLDLAPIPIPPGVLVVNSGTFTPEGLLSLNVTQEFIDYNYGRGVELLGTEGDEYLSLDPRDQHTADGTVDLVFEYDYDGIGEIQVIIKSKDLNGDPVRSLPFYVKVPRADIYIREITHNEETGNLNVVVAGRDLSTIDEISAYSTTEYGYYTSRKSSSIVNGQGEVEITVPTVISNDSFTRVKVIAPKKSGGSVTLHGVKTLTIGADRLPTVDLDEGYISHVGDGEVLSTYLEIASTEDGTYRPLIALYGTPYLEDPAKIPLDGLYSPFRGDTWIRPVVVYGDRSVRGTPVYGHIDFVNAVLKPRVTEGDDLTTFISIYVHDIEFPVDAPRKLQVRPLASTDENDYVTFGEAEGFNGSSIPLSVIETIGTELKVRYLIEAHELHTYITDEVSVFTRPSDYPDMDPVIDNVYFDSFTGETVVEGHVTTNDRPLDITLDVYENDVKITSASHVAKWDGYNFTSRGTGRSGFNVDVAVRVSGLDTVNRREAISPKFLNAEIHAGMFKIKAVQYSTYHGGIAFTYVNGSEIGHETIEVTATDSDGVTVNLPHIRGANTGAFTQAMYSIPEWMRGDITYTVYQTLFGTKIKVSDSITLPVNLPHVMNSASIDMTPVQIDREALQVVGYPEYIPDSENAAIYQLLSSDRKEGKLIYSTSDNNDLITRSFLLSSTAGMLQVSGRFEVGRQIVTRTVELEYEGPLDIFTFVANEINGDLVIKPKPYEGTYPSHYVGTWYFRDDATNTPLKLGYPYEYGGEGKVGERVPNYALASNGTGLLTRAGRTAGRPIRLYAKMPTFNADLAPRIIEVLQAGRFLEVQWRIRPDVVSVFSNFDELAIRVTDSNELTTSYPIDKTSLSDVNLTQIEVPDELEGVITLTVVGVKDGSESVPSMFNYLLKDKPHVAIVKSSKTNLYQTTLHFLSYGVTVTGEYTPRVTVRAHTFDGIEVLAEEVKVDFLGETGQLTIPVGSYDSTNMEVVIDFWPVEGTLAKHTVTYELCVASKVKWVNTVVNGVLGGEVTMVGNVYTPSTAGIYTLQTRENAHALWEQSHYELTRSVTDTLDKSVDLTFVRTDNEDVPDIKPLTAFRIGTHGPEGIEYDETFNLSTEDDFEIIGIEDVNTLDGVYDYTIVYFHGRNIKPKSKLQMLTGDNTLSEEALKVGEFTADMGDVKSYSFIKHTGSPTLPITLRVDTEGEESLMATYPHGATPNMYPSELFIRDVKYVTAEDGESVALYATIELPLMNTATAVIAVNSLPAVNISDELVEIEDNRYEFYYTVDDNDLTTFTITVVDLAGVPWTKRYVFTGDEITEGDWGVIIIPPPVPVPTLSVVRDVFSIYNTFTAEVTFAIDDDRLDSYPDAILTYADDPETPIPVTLSKGDNDGEFKTTVTLLNPGVREFELIVTMPDEIETYSVTRVIDENDPTSIDEISVPLTDVAFNVNPATSERLVYLIVELPDYLAYRGDITFNKDPLTRINISSNWGRLDNGHRWVSAVIDSGQELTSIEVGGNTGDGRRLYASYTFTGEEPTFTRPEYERDDDTLALDSTGLEFDYSLERDTHILKFKGTGHLLGDTYTKALVDGVECNVSDFWVSSGRDRYRIEVDVPNRDVRQVHLELQRDNGVFVTLSFYLTKQQIQSIVPERKNFTSTSYVVNPNTNERMYSFVKDIFTGSNVEYTINLEEGSQPIDRLLGVSADTDLFLMKFAGDSIPTHITVFSEDESPAEIATHVFSADDTEVTPNPITVQPSKVLFSIFESGLTEVFVRLSETDIIAESVRVKISGAGEFVVPTTSLRIFEGAYEFGLEIPSTDITSISVKMLDDMFIPHVIEYTVTGDEEIVDLSTPTNVVRSMGDFEIDGVLFTEEDGDMYATMTVNIPVTSSSNFAVSTQEGLFEGPPSNPTNVVDNNDGTFTFKIAAPAGTEEDFVLAEYRMGPPVIAYYFANGIPDVAVPVGVIELSDPKFAGALVMYKGRLVINTYVEGPDYDWAESTVTYTTRQETEVTLPVDLLDYGNGSIGLTIVIEDVDVTQPLTVNFASGETKEFYIGGLPPIEYTDLESGIYYMERESARWTFSIPISPQDAEFLIEDSIYIRYDDGRKHTQTTLDVTLDGTTAVVTVTDLDTDVLTFHYMLTTGLDEKVYGCEFPGTTLELYEPDLSGPAVAPLLRLRDIKVVKAPIIFE